MRDFLIFGASIAALASTVPAHAELVDARSPRAIAAIVESQGWKSEITSPDGEPPYIKATRGGELFVVGFMNCTDGKDCRTLQFFLGFRDAKDVPLEKLNEWNRDKRFARAYRDDEGDPVLVMDIDLDFAGLPRENVGEMFNTWAGLMDSFRTFVRGE